MLRLTVTMALALVFSGCGSLMNELERIRNKATATNAGGATAPVVLYTIPADGTVSAPLQSYIDVVYDQPIDSATVNAPTNGNCNGTAQASTNNFDSCGGAPAVTGNTVRITANGGVMPQGAAIKIQMTSAIKGTNGLAATEYTSPAGISFTSPCGQNCFYSDSAPLSGASGNGSHAFVIPSGAKAGWIIVINGGGTNTTLWNPETNQTLTGPPTCNAIASGAHSFEVKTLGGARSGKFITYAGGGGTSACTFDNNTETFSSGPLLGGATPNTGSMTIPVLAGGNAGKYLLLQGGNTVAYLYDVGSDSFGVTPSIGGSPSTGAYWIRYDAGPQSGNPLIVTGNGFGTTRFYNEAGNSFSSLYTSTIVNGAGALGFKVNSGALAGHILLVHGGGATTSTGYDQNTGELAGPSLGCAVSNGSLAQTLSSGPRSGQTIILCGGASTQYTYYDHSSNSTSSMFSGSGVIGGDSSLTRITTGVHAGKYLLVNGNITGTTSMIDPSQDTFHGSRLFRATVAGTTAFAIKSGLKAGRLMIMTGGTASTIYNPQNGLTEQGPIAPGALNAGSGSIPVTNGASAGMQYIFQGGSSVIFKYDPNTNTFATATLGVDYFTTPTPKGLGTKHLLIPSGPQANNYLILNGGVANADYFNTSTNTFTTGVAVTGCGAFSAGSWIFKINSGIHLNKFMIICGSAVTTSLFDPSGATFASGPTMGASPASGAHGFYVSSGVNSGKFLLVMASGSTTRLYDPATNTWAAGPALVGVAGAGGFNIPITNGANAGKTLVVLGGGLTGTCYYDPASNSFGAGPVTGSHQGYAVGGDSIAIATGGGIYPAAYFVAYGALSTTFGHWFAY